LERYLESAIADAWLKHVDRMILYGDGRER